MSYGPPNSNQTSAYLQRQLEQATPVQTLLLLLDGALKFTLQAKEAITRQDVAARHAMNARAIEIITYLLSQQDPAQAQPHEKAGVASLQRILSYILRQQLKVDFANSVEVCDDIAMRLRQLRAGFASLQPSSNVVAAPNNTADAAPRPLAAMA